MAETIAHTIPGEVHESHAHHHELSFFRKYIWSLDHKTIALQYLFTSMVFLLVGGLLAMGVRFQLAFPNAPVPFIGTLLPSWLVTSSGAFQPAGYNGLVTMHAPVMAFPFFNALSYWLFLLSGLVLLASFFVPAGFPASGWTSYAPLSSHGLYNGTQAGQSLWCVGLFINGLASIGGAANYITTIINMRAPGMKMFRLPLPVWALFITAILVLLAVPVLS